ncbi:MAG: FkbM family methyltransferase [Armatimonadota bacterium]|nr:FkbM family methyltransferase [Armatimonadota bacterium]MCX7778229.1 FkbM family methyltransferase [Armatimonadota bacterium]MDW8024960.1 FkbM family methyltransferase [Armatimonadota bacterium]
MRQISFAFPVTNSTLKKLLKLLKPIGERLKVPVRQGPLKGFYLLAVAPLRFFKGTYEPETTALFVQFVKLGDIVYDIGAHMCYFTLIASKQVGSEGMVVAFEPCPTNVRILKKHLQINGITNVETIEAAVTESSGKARFAFGTGTGKGHLAIDGELEVKTVCIDELVEKGIIPPPKVIKVDVEGAEMRVIAGAIRTISTYRPIIFLATHSESLSKACDKVICSFGYLKRQADSSNVIYIPSKLVYNWG